MLDHLNAEFRSVYTPELWCVSRWVFDDVEGIWYIPSKHARFGIKSFELCEAKLVICGVLLFTLGRVPFSTSP
jgi:hypothetical protein